MLTVPLAAQVLGRNLEALVTRAQDIKADWKDEFVSVEHMLLAFLDDAKFGTNLLKGATLDKAKLEAAVKEIRGSNRVTDQVAVQCLPICNSLYAESSTGMYLCKHIRKDMHRVPVLCAQPHIQRPCKCRSHGTRLQQLHAPSMLIVIFANPHSIRSVSTVESKHVQMYCSSR